MEKIKVFGIGGTGCNIVGKIPLASNLSVSALDINICPLKWLNCEKILCGQKLCRGVGCNSIEESYQSAVETLTDKRQLFENEINIFVFSLGEMAGNGITRFILEGLAQMRKTSTVNKCNILLVTFPLNIETKRAELAKSTLETFKSLCDFLIIVRLETVSALLKEIKPSCTISDVLWESYSAMYHILCNIADLEKSEFYDILSTYEKDETKIKYLENVEEVRICFLSRKKVKPEILANMDTHSTGQGRDLNQLRAIEELTWSHVSMLFVGCASGEEMLDMQLMSTKIGMHYVGTDYDAQTIERAKDRKYHAETKLAVVDVLKPDFKQIVDELASPYGCKFVVCRNLLIYYRDDVAKQIIEILANIAEEYLVLGISDPFPFKIQKNNDVIIGNSIFQVTDFDNRIFRKRIHDKSNIDRRIHT